MEYGRLERQESKIIQLLNQGKSAYFIAKEMECAKTSILAFMRKRDIKSNFKPKNDKNNLLKNKVELVTKLHLDGKSNTEIAVITGHSSGGMNRFINSLGLPPHPQNIYNVNESFFDKIDNEIKAYILGMFYSDGCVDNIGKMRIQLQERDRYILERIKLEMGYTGPLYEIPIPKNNPYNSGKQVCLCINRKVLSDKLINLGCSPNKSLVLSFPTKEQVPENVLKYFIRGFFDGDGGITKRFCISLTSTDIFNIKLQKILVNLGIYSKYYYRRKGKNTCSLQINRLKDIKSFLDWIYEDSNIHLERKYNKYLEFLTFIKDKA